MKIEIGKRYWTLEGGISPVVKEGQYKKSPDTRGLYTDDTHLSRYSLVAEYTGPKLVPPLGIQVGKRYVTKRGWVTAPVQTIAADGWLLTNEGLEVHELQIKREYLGRDDPINKEI